MATNQKFIGGLEVNRHLLTAGAALTGVGALIGMTGAMIVGVALFSAGRGWVRQLPTPPSEVAARKLHQARAASMAGLDAWRSGTDGSSN